MSEQLFRYVPHDRVPEFRRNGWRIVDDMSTCHHGAYSVLMRYAAPERKGKAAMATTLVVVTFLYWAAALARLALALRA